MAFTPEMARRFAGRLRLSQTAQRQVVVEQVNEAALEAAAYLRTLSDIVIG